MLAGEESPETSFNLRKMEPSDFQNVPELQFQTWRWKSGSGFQQYPARKPESNHRSEGQRSDGDSLDFNCNPVKERHTYLEIKQQVKQGVLSNSWW